MHLVDRHRAGVRLGAAATLDPLVVAPLVTRRKMRDALPGGFSAAVAYGSDLSSSEPSLRGDLEAVERALRRVGDDGLPDAGHAALLHRVRAAVPAVPLADDRHLGRVRRPDREGDALVGDVRAELLVDALVTALADEVQVDVADTGCSRACALPRACAGSRRPGCGSSRAGCSARSATRRPPSRARRRSAAARRRPRPQAAAPGRRSRGSRRGTPRARATPSLPARRAAQDLDGRHGVRERAQHSGDVAQRRALAPSLGERARRLALEVDQHPVARLLATRASGRGAGRRACGSSCRTSPRARAARATRGPPRRGRGSGRAPRRPPEARRRCGSISSSTVAVSSASDSVLGSSGAKFGSLESAPSTACIAPVTRPSRRSRVRKRSGSVSSSSSASSQPSTAPRTYSWRTPSVVSSGRPMYAYQPREPRDVLRSRAA